MIRLPENGVYSKSLYRAVEPGRCAVLNFRVPCFEVRFKNEKNFGPLFQAKIVSVPVRSHWFLFLRCYLAFCGYCQFFQTCLENVSQGALGSTYRRRLHDCRSMDAQGAGDLLHSCRHAAYSNKMTISFLPLANELVEKAPRPRWSVISGPRL